MLCLSCLFLMSHFTDHQFRMCWPFPIQPCLDVCLCSWLHVASTSYTHPVCGAGIWAQISVLLCSHPTEFLHLEVTAGSPLCHTAKSRVRQHGASRYVAWSRGSNFETSQQQKDIAQVSETRTESRALHFDLKPYTKSCMSDEIQVFSTTNANKIYWVLISTTTWRLHQDDGSFAVNARLPGYAGYEHAYSYYYLLLHIGE